LSSKILDGRKIAPSLDKPALIYRSTKHAIPIGVQRYPISLNRPVISILVFGLSLMPSLKKQNIILYSWLSTELQ